MLWKWEVTTLSPPYMQEKDFFIKKCKFGGDCRLNLKNTFSNLVVATMWFIELCSSKPESWSVPRLKMQMRIPENTCTYPWDCLYILQHVPWQKAAHLPQHSNLSDEAPKQTSLKHYSNQPTLHDSQSHGVNLWKTLLGQSNFLSWTESIKCRDPTEFTGINNVMPWHQSIRDKTKYSFPHRKKTSIWQMYCSEIGLLLKVTS